MASTCRLNSLQNRIYCPSNYRVFNKPLINSGASYPIKAETAVIKNTVLNLNKNLMFLYLNNN